MRCCKLRSLSSAPPPETSPQSIIMVEVAVFKECRKNRYRPRSATRLRIFMLSTLQSRFNGKGASTAPGPRPRNPLAYQRAAFVYKFLIARQLSPRHRIVYRPAVIGGDPRVVGSPRRSFVPFSFFPARRAVPHQHTASYGLSRLPSGFAAKVASCRASPLCRADGKQSSWHSPPESSSPGGERSRVRMPIALR
jgi:hypothetical protein